MKILKRICFVVLLPLFFICSSTHASESATPSKTGLANTAFLEIWNWYGPQNSALYADENAYKNTPTAVLDDIFDRWFNISDGYLSRHKHWHKDDRSDVTFENFTKSFYFFPADKKFSSVTAVCKNRSTYNEILVFTNGVKWLDLNQGGIYPYSVTLWDWYNTVAIKSDDQTFIEHFKPTMYRWNASVSASIMEAILRTGKFEIYVEGNPYRSGGMILSKKDKQEYEAFPNLNLKASVTIENIDEVRNCFDVKKPAVANR